MKTEEIMKILEENKITNVHKKKEKKMSNQLFWKRSAILYNAWKQAEHKDMKKYMVLEINRPDENNAEQKVWFRIIG